MPADKLKQLAQDYGLVGEVSTNPKMALELARKKADANDLIFIGGSTFVVADVL
jgi:dihydrofolate synthase/folylpolyglutamate synthase